MNVSRESVKSNEEVGKEVVQELRQVAQQAEVDKVNIHAVIGFKEPVL